MKILFVPSDNNSTSGAFLSMVKLTQLLRDSLDVEVLVILPKKGDGEILLQEINIPYTYIKSYDWVIPLEKCNDKKVKVKNLIKHLYNQIAIHKIVKYVKQNQIDIIHINTTYAYVGALAAKKAKIPFVWHLREFVEEDQGRTLWSRSKGNQLIAEANKVIAISSSVFFKYERIVPKERIHLILNGIDTEKFYCPNKKIFQNEKISLIYGGGYARRKGIYELASALQLLLEMGITNFELKLIGEPNPKYKEYLKKIGLEPYVKYLGYQKNVTQWYEKADIAFSCSTLEAFGRKTVEAMLAGTLMIAANTGGTLDIIEDKKTGLLYKQGDPIDLAFKIIFAITNKEECKKISSYGRMYAYKNLTARKNAELVKAVYEEILQEE